MPWSTAAIDQFADIAGPVQQAVVAVAMQMHKRTFFRVFADRFGCKLRRGGQNSVISRLRGS